MDPEKSAYSLKFTTGQVLHFLVDEVVKIERLDDICLELRRQEGRPDLLEEQLPDRALKLGSDRLGLHADSHLWHLCVAIRFENARQETAESRLPAVSL